MVVVVVVVAINYNSDNGNDNETYHDILTTETDPTRPQNTLLPAAFSAAPRAALAKSLAASASQEGAYGKAVQGTLVIRRGC